MYADPSKRPNHQQESIQYRSFYFRPQQSTLGLWSDLITLLSLFLAINCFLAVWPAFWTVGPNWPYVIDFTY